jgi:membrane-bound ClpP family serine protease
MSPQQWELIGGAVGLMALAGSLVVLEFAVISWGVLTIAAAGCLIGGWMMAYAAAPMAGWLYICASPVAAFIAVRVGLAWMRAAGAVVTSAITADAGYHHLASEAGITAGARGELVTDAMPTGRARFPGGEADVQVQGAVLPRGAPVVVVRVEGPVVIVVASR